tara:strand:+ start:452 stop:790 length:339 start_codon:yes stop_codon:yes gene_type:complete
MIDDVLQAKPTVRIVESDLCPGHFLYMAEVRLVLREGRGEVYFNSAGSSEVIALRNLANTLYTVADLVLHLARHDVPSEWKSDRERGTAIGDFALSIIEELGINVSLEGGEE